MRGDIPAAAKLLERATRLLREDGGPSPETLIELGSVLAETGDLADADAAFEEALEASSDREDARLASRASLERSFVRGQVDSNYTWHQLREDAEAAVRVFDDLGDDLGVAIALTRVAEAHWALCQVAECEKVLEQALVHAVRAGDKREIVEIYQLLTRAVVVGPRPASEAIRRCREILAQAGDQPRLEASIEFMLAVLEAMRGHADDARAHYRHSQQLLADLGLKMLLASAQMCSGFVELILRQPEAAERELRSGYATLENIGERSQLSTMAALLARALVSQARYDEAERYSAVSEEAASEDDLASQVMWRAARARTCARRNEIDRAERLAREAVALARSSDFVDLHADVLMDFAYVVRAARPAEAAAAVGEALSLYEAKGNIVSAAEARAIRSEWQTASPA